MCATCGCGTPNDAAAAKLGTELRPHDHAHPHDHGHDHDLRHPHDHDHHHDHDGPHALREGPSPDHVVAIEQDILARNDALAADNRRLFAARELTVFNLTSSPGSGKTTLIEALAGRLAGRVALSVVEGDQETERDAERVRALGIPAVQINTRTGCHLDAGMVRRAVEQLAPPSGSLLLIENVGNLVCPALFELGERTKIVLMSVTEGEDKPLKYPHMFRAAGVLLLSKVDLLPHLQFDLVRCLAHARRVNPGLRVFQISAQTGAGMIELADWLVGEVRGARA